MIKIIKRTTDKKFLQSVETDTWVDSVNEAFEMSYKECENTKTELLKNYTLDQIIEIVNLSKNKPISKEEIKELRDLLGK